jgi:hypothetical protein
MKALLTLSIALMACPFLFAQSSGGGDPARIPKPVSPVHPLSHEDSLVMIEAGVRMLPPPGEIVACAEPGHVAKTAGRDSIPGTDSLSEPDSLMRSRTRILPFSSVIEAVLHDFPYNLRNITGELVLAQGEFENYASTVALAGAGSCIVTRYHSVDDTTASWQAKMYTGDDFKKAAQEYHELYKKLQRCYVRLVDGSLVYVSGVWEPAKEEAAFTTSTLRLTTGDWRYKDVKIELEIVYLLTEWTININIITKKRDDEVGGGQVGVNTQ